MAAVSLGCCSTFLAGEPSLAKPIRQAFSCSVISLPGWRTSLVLCAASKPAASEPAAGKREPRGITKPRPISPAMQALLGVPEIARTQALKQIWAYIKQHNLQSPENKKVIVCDEKLKNIFGGRQHVGFLEISGLLNPHFMK